MSHPGDADLWRLFSSATPDPVQKAHVDGCAQCKERLNALGSHDHTLASGNRTEETALPAIEPGAQFDRYTILDRVGAGGMGEVYAAYDPRLDRRVALKVLRADTNDDDPEPARQRLFREAQALARLNHPAVVAVHDVGLAGNEVYVAMEFVDGHTLTEWLQEAPRSHEEILRTLCQAGEGLAAAHAAGLVHRDFKPGNVLLGRDGRVRVADFGLARAPGEQEQPTAPRDLSAPGFTAHTPLPALTHVDAVVGTPGYMPLEQFEGLPIDHRADQFSFCVTLYEALCRHRPYGGETLHALGTAMAAWLPPSPPQGVDLPAPLYAVLRRGLSPRRSDRFSDMRALLDALQRFAQSGNARRKRTVRILAAGAVVVLAAAVVTGLRTPGADPCADASRSPSLFDEGQRARLSRVFGATGTQYASQAAGMALGELDAWSRAWTGLREETCRAARIDQTLPEATFAVREACLALAAEQARSLVSVLLTADDETVRNAAGAIGRLPHPTSCLDARALASLEQVPQDAQVRAAVQGLRVRLAGLRAQYEAGRYADVVGQLSSLLKEAEATEHLPVVAEARLLRGMAKERTSSYAEAFADLHRAAQLGIEGRDDLTAGRAFMELSKLTSRVEEDHDAAARWLAYGRSALERSGTPAREQVELAFLEGYLHHMRRDYRTALARYDEALELQERLLPRDHAMRVTLLDESGWMLSWLNRHQEGMARYDEAMALAARVFGDGHPETANLLDRAGAVLEELNELERAHALLARALAVREATQGRDAEVVGTSLNHLALVLGRLGRAQEGQAAARRALNIYIGHLGPDHERVASVRHTLGLMYELSGDLPNAIEAYRVSLSLFERRGLADTPLIAYSLQGLGSALLKAGEPGMALGPLRRAHAVREKGEPLPNERGQTRFALARALWLTGERQEVRALLEGARADFVTAGPKGAAALAELEQFASAHVAVQPTP